MAELRSFSIINSAGEELSLMEKNTFGNTPTGLGLELTNTYYQAYGSFITDDITVKQGQFSVEMVYGAMSNKPYAQFHEAVKVLNAPPLILRYDIPDVGTYFRDIQFVSMAKSEIEEATGVLRSACVFDFTSPWYAWKDVNAYIGHYLHNQSKLMATTNSGPSAVYPYIYQSDFTSGAPFVRIRNSSLYMGTQDDSPMVVTVSATSDTGPVSNPSWMLYDSDGSLIQQDRYVLTIPVGYQLIVSTDWKNRFAVLHSVSGAEADQDVSAQIDPTVKGFVRAPVGESRLQLDKSTLDQIGDFMGNNIKVQLKEEWLVV